MSDCQRYTKHFTLEMANHPASSMSCNENELINDCQRALDDGTKKDPMVKIRLLCLAHGTSGIVGLGRAFRHMEDDGNKELSLEEFTKGLRDTGIDVSDEDAQNIFEQFDVDDSGSINMAEFLIKIRPRMSESRHHIIGEAFKKLDKSSDGPITIADLKHVYSVQSDPQYTSGEQTEEQIIKRFLANFEAGGSVDGHVTEEEFLAYYAGISASVENDTYFDLLMRQLYKL